MEETQEQETRPKRLSGWQRGLLELAVLALVIFGARSTIADWNHVPSGSMQPTLLIGDVIWVNRLAYDLKVPFTHWHLAEWDAPERGDVVVFDAPHNGMRMVKRVVGLPGDSVAMRDNRVFVNGEALAYAPAPAAEGAPLTTAEREGSLFAYEQLGDVEHLVMVAREPTPRSSFAPVEVPEGQYLLLGDNRDNSGDSRFFGFVDRARILGRATRVILSLDPDAWYLPRGDRWIEPLEPAAG